MRPNKIEAILHGYHCANDMAVRMRVVVVILSNEGTMELVENGLYC